MRKNTFSILLFSILLMIIFPQHALATTEQPYIILFENEIDEQLIEEAGATVVDRLKNSPIVTILADGQAYEKLQQAEFIRSIEADQKMRVSAQTTDWGIGPIKVASAWNNGYTGKDVKIAVVDSGIGPHEDLKRAGSVSFLETDLTDVDHNGHGTHIAGIIGALDNGIGVKGIAPGSQLYALKVFDKNGFGFTSDVIRAIDWSIENDMDIINLSLTSKIGSVAYEQIVNLAYTKGILLVAAAGNATEINPGIDTVEYPAKYGSVIAVASVNQESKKGYLSSIGPAVEIAAPGVSIYSTYLNNTYDRLSGTSLATAFITGQLALMKEAYPSLNNVQLRKKMVDDAMDLGPKGWDPIFGSGLMQTSAYDTPLYEYPAKNNPVKSLSLSKENIVGEAGGTVGVSLIATYKNGMTLDVSDFARWTSKNGAIATSRGGRIDLHDMGSTSLQATYGGLKIDLPLEVVEASEPSNENELPFTDLSDDYWALDEINEVYKKMIITGYKDNTFRPSDFIKREHVAVMMARTLQLEKKKDFSPFHDVTMKSPYFYEIMKTQQAGVFSGNDKGFEPNHNLTRAQMAKVIAEAFHLPKTTNHPFRDVAATHWANDYVATLYEAGITTGSDGQFKPDRYVTRAEFTVFIQRAMNQ